MRFSASLILALPLMAAAESPFGQYRAQFQNFIGKFMAADEKPAEAQAPPPAAAKAKVYKEPKLAVLTLENWNSTLYGPVKAGATKPEEWWVLVTGRNKTCYGHCLQAETAYNETAKKFATLPNTPHMAYLNCEDQPILCTSWSVAAGNLWVLDMLPPPAPIHIYKKRLNLTSTTTKTFIDLQAANERDEFIEIQTLFHPFDGPLARYGLSTPVAYVLYYFGLIPGWVLMLGVSFISRSMMSNRMNQMNRNQGQQQGQQPGGPARAPPAQ